MNDHAECRKPFLATTSILALAVPLVAGALAAPRLRAQAPAAQSPTADDNRPAFDAASIKPNKSGDGRHILGSQPGGRFVGTNISLGMLIDSAYQLRPHQRVGGPQWIDSEHFDVEAKATMEGRPTRDQLSVMLQGLLADRFKLLVHHETRQLPIYALVVSKPGSLSPSGASKCTPLSAGVTPPSLSGAAAPLPTCGSLIQTKSSVANAAHYSGRSIPIGTLVTIFGGLMDRVVVDKTGLTGTYDLELEFTRPTSLDAGAPDAAPSLFAALQEQLGLRLESQTGPVDVLVIDHVEEPSPN